MNSQQSKPSTSTLETDKKVVPTTDAATPVWAQVPCPKGSGVGNIARVTRGHAMSRGYPIVS